MAVEIEASERLILDRIVLPPRPKVLTTINAEAKKETASFALIANAIAEDVGISSAALQIVNSPAFRRSQNISSIDQALNLLGLKRVLAIVNAVSVRSAMKTTRNLEDFWEYGTCVANAGVIIAQERKMINKMDDAYTIGLFHDACAPFMMTQFPSYYDFFIAGNAEGWELSFIEEKQKYHTTHTTLAALMAQEWCLPGHIVNAIYNLHRLNGALAYGDYHDQSLILLAILKFAREVARINIYNECDNPEWLRSREQVFELLNIDINDFMEIRDIIIDKFNDA